MPPREAMNARHAPGDRFPRGASSLAASPLTITDGYVFVPNDSHRVSDFGGANFSVVAW